MKSIDVSDIEFHTHSFFDPVGRLFWWRDELFRGITSEWVPFFEQLLKSSTFRRLVDAGVLVETEVTDLRVDGYELIVHHKTLPFVSYPYEWCTAMFKDAILLSLDLAIELETGGFTLRDAHPRNVLFHNAKPIYIDFSAIGPRGDTEFPHDHFCQYFLFPLIVMSGGKEKIARLLLSDGGGISEEHLIKLTGKTYSARYKSSPMIRLQSFLKKRIPNERLTQIESVVESVKPLFYGENNKDHSRIDLLRSIRADAQQLRMPRFQTSKRTDTNSSLSTTSRHGWSVKQRHVHKLLSDLRPLSVLDVGSGSGWYSKMAAKLDSQVVSIDIDEACITQLYSEARDNKLKILPLIMDITRPTPSCGPSNHWSIVASQRLQCDMVLALGILDILVRDLYFEQIVEGLWSFTKRWVLIEFIPREDPVLSCQWWSTRLTWYTLDNLMRVLKGRFSHIVRIASSRAGRVLILCEK